MERKLTRIDIPWCNACKEKECHSSNGECAMIRIYQKAKVPTQNPWCDICGKDDCDKIICGFTTCEGIQRTTEIIKAAADLLQQIDIGLGHISQLKTEELKIAIWPDENDNKS